MQIDYTAKRSIQSGHVLDTAYSITFNVSNDSRSFARVGPAPLVALSGNRVTTTFRNEEKRKITTTLHQSGDTVDVEDMREFMDSIANGEPFDIDGITHFMEGNYRETREINYYRYSFTAVLFP